VDALKAPKIGHAAGDFQIDLIQMPNGVAGRFAGVAENDVHGRMASCSSKDGKLNLLRLSLMTGKHTSSAASNCSTTIKIGGPRGPEPN
jgi:hypothetical protein